MQQQPEQNIFAIPGQMLVQGFELVRAHGTYMLGQKFETCTKTSDKLDDGKTTELTSNRTNVVLEWEDPKLPAGMYSSQAGLVEQVNRVITVNPLKTCYAGKAGDVIVGRVVEVQQKRWKVECNSSRQGTLALTDAQLPDGELRCKSEEDERAMRNYLKEGDLIVAEVREVQADRALRIHMRSEKFGKLGQGCLVKYPIALMKRRGMLHIHHLACGVTLILGANGVAWIGNSACARTGFIEDSTRRTPDELLQLTRIRFAIQSLISVGIPLWETSVQYVWEELNNSEHSLWQYNCNGTLLKELMDIVKARLLHEKAI